MGEKLAEEEIHPELVVEGTDPAEGFGVGEVLVPSLATCQAEFAPFGSCCSLAAFAVVDRKQGQTNAAVAGTEECFVEGAVRSLSPWKCLAVSRIPDRTCCQRESVHHTLHSSRLPPSHRDGHVTLPKGLRPIDFPEAQRNADCFHPQGRATHIFMAKRKVVGTEGEHMAVLVNEKIDKLLETTSRSFYPTLKYLPKKTRGQIGLLYLLARVADTIADTKHGETTVLTESLRAYNGVVQTGQGALPQFEDLAEMQENPHEAALLRHVPDVIEGLDEYSIEDRQRMLECLDIIVHGQLLDLERFGPANEGGKISALANNEELDDYTFRVAGCVGVFWTKMSLAHLMELSPEEEKVFMERGIRFGKALQMINILRDIPEDLRFGRCYLPEDMLEKHGLKPEDLLDDGNLEAFRPLYDTYLDLTNEHLEAATAYIQMIPETQFRLKASCMLPVLVGQRTVTLLREGNILNSDERIKVTRDEMKTYARKLLRALLIPGGVRRLLEKNRDK